MNNPVEKAMEITGYSAERIAELLGVSKTTINNYRNNPGAMGVEEFNKLSQETGISLDMLLGSRDSIPGPKLKTVYSKSAAQIEKAIKYAESHLADIERINIDEKYKLAKEEHRIALENFKDIIGNTKVNGRKPLVGALGPSDSGKSTLMNYLLGTTVIPAAYTPMTTVPTYIMHISEKPDIFEDQADNAVVFGRPVDSRKKKFKHEMIYDSDIAGKYVIRKGNYESILKDFGTRDGAYYENETWNIEEIVIYVDADILKEVTLVDLPGFGTGDRKDDDVSLTMDMRRFDFIFLLSPADGFQRATEAGAFLDVLRNIRGKEESKDKTEDLNRIYFLATHCNSIGNPDKVKEIIHRGCERLVKMMPEGEKERFGIDENHFKTLEKRFFGFENTVKFYCETLNKDIEKNFPTFAKNKYDSTIKSLNAVCTEYDSKYKKELKKIQKGKGKTPGQKREKKRAKEFLKKSKEALDESNKKLKESASEYCKKHMEDMSKGYSDTFNETNIQQIIKNKDLKNKKTDIETLVNYLSAELGDLMADSMKKHGNAFAKEVNAEITNYKQNVNRELKDLNSDIDMNGFDFTRAFASGLAGVATYGALAIWATVVAAGSNLGAYILVAKVVSALSALGISVGGTGAVVSAIAAIGGPVTIGITLALLAAVAVFGIFTGTWQSRVAKRLIKEFEKERVLPKYMDQIEKYWDDTCEALDSCFKELHEQTVNYYEAAAKADELEEEDRIASGIIIENLFKTLQEIYGEIMKIAVVPDDNEDEE